MLIKEVDRGLDLVEGFSHKVHYMKSPSEILVQRLKKFSTSMSCKGSFEVNACSHVES